MAVFRVEKTKDFTVMSNHHLRNTELSLKAKGLLYISAPLLTLTGISRKRRSRNSLAFPKTRRCQRAMRSTSMTGKTPIPEITTGNPAPIM